MPACISGLPSRSRRSALARLPDALRDHVHGRLEIEHLCPRFSTRRAVLHLRRAPVMRDELVASPRPFGQRWPREIGDSGSPSIDDDLPVAMVDELTASDAAVRTDRSRDLAPRRSAAAARASRRSSPRRPCRDGRRELTNERPA